MVVSVDETAILLAAFRRVSECWGMTAYERAAILAAESEPEVLTSDQWLRISYVFGIFAGLHAVMGATELVDDWVRRPNLDFGGDPPLEIMLEGIDGLARVRAYVDRWAD